MMVAFREALSRMIEIAIAILAVYIAVVRDLSIPIETRDVFVGLLILAILLLLGAWLAAAVRSSRIGR